MTPAAKTITTRAKAPDTETVYQVIYKRSIFVKPPKPATGASTEAGTGDGMVEKKEPGEFIDPAETNAEYLEQAVRMRHVAKITIALDPQAATARPALAAKAGEVELSDRGPHAVARLDDLIAALEAEGCTVSVAAKYRALMRVDPTAAIVTTRYLDLSPEEHGGRLLANALRLEARQRIADGQYRADEKIREEVREAMAAEADSYLDTLRRPFDAAAEEARNVASLGVKSGDTAETLITEGRAKIDAWLAFRDSPAIPTLERITALREDMAEVLGIGEGKGGDHSVGVTLPAHPWLLAPERRFEPEHAKWIEAAPDLVLVPLAGVSDDDKLRARGFDPELLRLQARKLRQARAH